MKAYYSWGGKSDPEFRYKVKVDRATAEMIKWCDDYPLNRNFERYYIIWNDFTFTFEVEEPAIMFALRWS